MNILINIFFIMLFTFTVLSFKCPNISANNPLMAKFILFVALFIFQYILYLIAAIRGKCKIDPAAITGSSIETAAIGIIGYSIYNDISPQLANAGGNKMQYLYITIIITFLLTLVNTTKLAFGYQPYPCIK